MSRKYIVFLENSGELLPKPDEFSQIRSRSIAMQQNLTKESHPQLAVATFTQKSDEIHSKEVNREQNVSDTTESDMVRLIVHEKKILNH